MLNIKNRNVVNVAFLASLIGMMVLASLLPSTAYAQDGGTSNLPAPFDMYLVYTAAGVYDADDPDYTAPDGDFWHSEIMGRSEEEIAQDRAEAVAFFEERFGINPDEHDGVDITSFMVDPRNEYRAYIVAGREVPAEGWVVRDGGWRFAVTAEDGVTLGGEFEGMQVPQGTFAVFGDYNIDADGEEIIIHYQSGQPIVPTPTDGIYFLCEISHPEWGSGLAQGIAASEVDEDGLTRANIRNILTFPGLGNEAE
jgi:hypothetical protein